MVILIIDYIYFHFIIDHKKQGMHLPLIPADHFVFLDNNKAVGNDGKCFKLKFYPTTLVVQHLLLI